MCNHLLGRVKLRGDLLCFLQVVTIFFGTFIAGSFLNQIQLFISAPKSILRILGAAAPQTASFFMSYVLLLGLTTKPILFLRIPRAPLVIACLISSHDISVVSLFAGGM